MNINSFFYDKEKCDLIRHLVVNTRLSYCQAILYVDDKINEWSIDIATRTIIVEDLANRGLTSSSIQLVLEAINKHYIRILYDMKIFTGDLFPLSKMENLIENRIQELKRDIISVRLEGGKIKKLKGGIKALKKVLTELKTTEI